MTILFGHIPVTYYLTIGYISGDSPETVCEAPDALRGHVPVRRAVRYTEVAAAANTECRAQQNRDIVLANQPLDEVHVVAFGIEVHQEVPAYPPIARLSRAQELRRERGVCTLIRPGSGGGHTQESKP